jgi:hypothetical protein
LREGIFARPLTAPKTRLGWERFRLSALAEDQNRKIFFLLKEKIAREKIKKCRENFFCFGLLYPPTGGGGKRKRTSFFGQG